jgi:hypothetical protein
LNFIHITVAGTVQEYEPVSLLSLFTPLMIFFIL